MDYKLALENAQRNVEQQKLALEKAKVTQTSGVNSSGIRPSSNSSSIDPAKVKQFMERRRLEMEAKKASTMAPPSRSLPTPGVTKLQRNGTNGDLKKGRPADSGTKKSQDSTAQKRLSDGANGGVGVTASKKPKHSSASTHSSSSSRLPQPPPPPPPPSSSSSASGPANVQRQYLMMRREELLKELEKIDKKLCKLNESDSGKPLASSVQQQHQPKQVAKDQTDKPKSYDRSGAVSNLPSVKKLSKINSTPTPSNRHSVHHSDDDQYDDEDDADSFIDDTEETGVEDYAKIVREVHRSLKFDPRRYAAVNPHDDCRGMVASYRDIQAEEMRSRRIGALEDAADMRDESERRARREEKRKIKG